MAVRTVTIRRTVNIRRTLLMLTISGWYTVAVNIPFGPAAALASRSFLPRNPNPAHYVSTFHNPFTPPPANRHFLVHITKGN